MKRWLAVFAYAILISIGSSIPGHEMPHYGFLIHDKIIHASEYSIFGFLLARAFGLRRWWWAAIAGGLFGVVDEFHQTFTPNRSGNDPGDMLADLVGSTIGAFAHYQLQRLRAKKAA